MRTQSDIALEAASEVSPTIDPASVVGWGVDADPQNDPTWPMRDRSQDDGPGLNWTPPVPQQADHEILQSVEHLRRPAVVGVTVAPRGLSGRLRRAAFRFSESQWGHWLLLMGADRVDVIESVLEDVGKGRPPNPLVEMGLVRPARAREAAIATALAAGVVAVGLVHLLRRRGHG